LFELNIEYIRGVSRAYQKNLSWTPIFLRSLSWVRNLSRQV